MQDFEQGLAAWRPLLKPAGILAVSEITWLVNSRDDEIQSFWEQAYPQIDTAAGKFQTLERQGYSPIGYFPLPISSWMDNYYQPLAASFESFLQRHHHSEAAREVVAEHQEEQALYEFTVQVSDLGQPQQSAEVAQQQKDEALRKRAEALRESARADHGQGRFNFEHGAISPSQSKEYLDHAFRRDYERNGPSLYRICRTTLEGWKRYRNDPDKRVRRRFVWESRRLQDVYCAMLWAMERRLRSTNTRISVRIGALRREIESEFGLKTALWGRGLGPVLSWTAGREERRLASLGVETAENDRFNRWIMDFFRQTAG